MISHQKQLFYSQILFFGKKFPVKNSYLLPNFTIEFRLLFPKQISVKLARQYHLITTGLRGGTINVEIAILLYTLYFDNIGVAGFSIDLSAGQYYIITFCKLEEFFCLTECMIEHNFHRTEFFTHHWSHSPAQVQLTPYFF